MLSDWDKNDAGNIALTPLHRMEVNVVFGEVAALRLELSQHPDLPHTELRAVQIGMSPEQARDLVGLLQWALDQIEPPPSQVN